MRFFLSLVLFFSVVGWGACTSFTGYDYQGTSMSGPDYQCRMNVVLSWASGSAERPCLSGEMHGCSVSGTAVSSTTIIKSCYYESSANRVRIDFLQCGNQCEADSVKGCPDGQVWDSQNCRCKASTSYHCQNSGGAESGGIGGSPAVALLFTCEDGVCTQTGKLNGTCQDWNFCPDGVTDCEVPCSGGDCPPCGRSGGSFTSSRNCYYSCFDGKTLSCRPSSTQYVAGSIYVGDCPSSPPSGCRPRSSSSGASSSASSSPSSSPSSSGSLPPPPFPRDTVQFPNNDGEDYEIDYTAILNAVLDTLHRANYQRDFQLRLQDVANFDLDNISNYSVHNYNELSKISSNTSSLNSTLSGLASGGFNLVQSTEEDISNSRRLLDEINQYLHSDSMLSPRPSDTTYNPLLRDIKGAIDSASFRPSVDTSIFARDSVFAKWWANYYSDSASSRGLVGKALNNIVKNFDKDSAKVADCNGYYDCMRVYNDMAYCKRAYTVSISDCVDGGTIMDGIWNVEASIFDAVWKGIFGDDSTDLKEHALDTDWVAPPAADSAKNSIMSTIRALFSSDSTAAILNKVKEMKDSVERSKRDSASVQPDSLWLDSSAAAHYVERILLPSGTSSECFVCSANLGNFGGLTDSSLTIYIDFGNFGGYDWCAIIRAVVKIATLVICISLTLGSWAAAFGYNPKNDA